MHCSKINVYEILFLQEPNRHLRAGSPPWQLMIGNAEAGMVALSSAEISVKNCPSPISIINQSISLCFGQDFETNDDLKYKVISFLEEVIHDPELLTQERKAAANIIRQVRCKGSREDNRARFRSAGLASEPVEGPAGNPSQAPSRPCSFAATGRLLLATCR